METAEQEEEYYLEEVEDEPEPVIEKPKRVSVSKGKPATEYQLANLAKGREALAKRKEERIKKEYDEMEKKKPVKELPAPPALKRNDPPELPKLPKKKKKAQKIIIQNDSSSSESDDEPTIVIRNSRKRNVEKPRAPSPEPEPEYYYEPEPAPFRLRRV